jgi:hypothetical protein
MNEPSGMIKYADGYWNRVEQEWFSKHPFLTLIVLIIIGVAGLPYLVGYYVGVGCRKISHYL